jgi:hypothetical protein
MTERNTSPAAERRHSARHSVTGLVHVTVQTDGNAFHAELIDISELGAKLRLSPSLEYPWLIQGNIIRLASTGPDTPLEISGTISWCSRFPEGHIAGIRFLSSGESFLRDLGFTTDIHAGASKPHPG